MRNSFARSLNGELYLFTRRRSIRIAHVMVLLLSMIVVVVNRGALFAFASLNGVEPSELAANNFWPQWASAVHVSMYVVELTVVLLVAGSLPHEVSTAAVRDPLSRNISRTVFILSRTVVAVLLPLTLYASTLFGAALSSFLLFDGGDIIEEGQVLLEISTDGVDTAIFKSMLHAILPLLTLGALASAFGALFRRGVVAAGGSFLAILLPTMLYSNHQEKMPYYFADFLPAFGPDSFLERSSQFAAGFADAYPYEYDNIAKIGWYSPAPILLLSVVFAIFVFKRRSL